MPQRIIKRERAMRIYRTMIEFQRAEGFSMTTRELCDAVGLKSNSNVSYHIHWLIKNGYAKQRGNQFRAIPQEG